MQLSRDRNDIGQFRKSTFFEPTGNSADKVRIVTDRGNMGVEISTPHGQARQGLFGHQLTQSTVISGDFQQVHNQLQMLLVNSASSQVDPSSLRDVVRDLSARSF